MSNRDGGAWTRVAKAPNEFVCGGPGKSGCDADVEATAERAIQLAQILRCTLHLSLRIAYVTGGMGGRVGLLDRSGLLAERRSAYGLTIATSLRVIAVRHGGRGS
jgi:hypothetical protein